jgi:hypothetical protein
LYFLPLPQGQGWVTSDVGGAPATLVTDFNVIVSP